MNTASLISQEAKALASNTSKFDYAQERERIETAYAASFDPYKDSAGLVIWTLCVTAAPKPVQKWFKAGPSLQAALAKAETVRAKLPEIANLPFTLALEGRAEILSKLGAAK